jgi:hypothetical protein
MRPVKHKQSALRTPLNRILGAEANIRLLRVACTEPFPMTRNALGKAAGLESKGAYLAANRLIAEGILRLEGRGVRQQVALEPRHPLARPLQELFWSESNRLDALLKTIREAAWGFREGIDAAWIEGAFARGEDRPAEALTVGVLADSNGIGAAERNMRKCLEEAETTADVTVEVVGYTRPDLATAKPAEIRRLEKTISIFGPPPLTYTSAASAQRTPKAVLHGDRERAQAVLADEIAQRVLRDPARVEAARRYIQERLITASDQERHELLEWASILRSMSSTRLYHFLKDPGERASRLRQTLPFLDVISPKEREDILKALNDA